MFGRYPHLHEITEQNHSYPMIIEGRSLLTHARSIRTIKHQYEAPKRSRPIGKDLISRDD
jgi:hypothetical protein